MPFYSYLRMFLAMTPLLLFQERYVFANIMQFTFRTWIGLILLTFFHNYLLMVLFLRALTQPDAIQAALTTI